MGDLHVPNASFPPWKLIISSLEITHFLLGNWPSQNQYSAASHSESSPTVSITKGIHDHERTR